MYTVGVFLICGIGSLVEATSAVDSFGASRIPLAIAQIAIAAMLLAVICVMFSVRDQCGDFEIDITPNDDAKVITLKNIGGNLFAYAIIGTIVVWFCCLGGIL